MTRLTPSKSIRSSPIGSSLRAFEPALLPRWSMNEDYLPLLASFGPSPAARRRDLNLVDSGSREGDR